MDIATLWRMPITLKQVDSSGEHYVYMELVTEQSTTHKLMRMSPRFYSSIRHNRGLKASTKLSDLRMKIFKLFICNNAITLIPIELEQDTQSVSITGEYEPCYTMYKYLLLLIQKFLTEVMNERRIQ